MANEHEQQDPTRRAAPSTTVPASNGNALIIAARAPEFLCNAVALTAGGSTPTAGCSLSPAAHGTTGPSASRWPFLVLSMALPDSVAGIPLGHAIAPVLSAPA